MSNSLIHRRTNSNYRAGLKGIYRDFKRSKDRKRLKTKGERIMSEKLLKDSEVAEWLGLKPATIRVWVHLGKIPHVKLGERCVRFEREKIENWIKSKTKQPRKAVEYANLG
jgi:excisionase family DNA binding protein